MISDVLSQAVEDMKWYVEHMPAVYAGRPRVLALIEQMEAMRRELDTPPPPNPDGDRDA
jgi:hypothetical protein